MSLPIQQIPTFHTHGLSLSPSTSSPLVFTISWGTLPSVPVPSISLPLALEALQSKHDTPRIKNLEHYDHIYSTQPVALHGLQALSYRRAGSSLL